MVSGAYTLTDTMRGAADSLSKSSYDGTAAVVSAKTAFEVGDDDYGARPTVPDRRSRRFASTPTGRSAASPTRPGCSTSPAT